ncbi:MAG: hypothetical protein ACFFBU_07130 [Promethearchaeota archaeon]
MVIRRIPTVTLLLILVISPTIFGTLNRVFDPRCQAPPPGPDIWYSDNDEIAYSVIETSDLPYVIAGQCQMAGSNNSDVLLLCTGYKTYGGEGNEGAREIVECQEGGFALVGYTTSYGAGNTDVWLLRTNSTGHHLWNRTYGTPEQEYGTSLIILPGGDFAITGYSTHSIGTDRDVWVLRIDANGNLLWNKTFGGTKADAGWSIILNHEGNLVVAGVTESFGAGDEDIWLLCIDTSGNHLWNQTFGGTAKDRGWDVTLVQDGGYAIIGYTTLPGKNAKEICLIRTDPAGYQIWNTTYGDNDEDDEGYSIIETSEGDFAMTGYAGGHREIWFKRSAGYGVYNSFGNQGLFGTSIIESSEGGFIIVGGTNTTSTETSHLVFWWLPSHYSPPRIGLDPLSIIIVLLFYGWPAILLITLTLAIMKWRNRKHKT